MQHIPCGAVITILDIVSDVKSLSLYFVDIENK